MTDTPPKPRRWRWLVALVMLLAVAGWWYWPRGDARLIGRWGEFEPGLQTPRVVWDFRACGVLYYVNSSRPQRPTRFAWKLVGDEVRLGIPRSNLIAPVLKTFAGWLYLASGVDWQVSGSTYGIVPASPGRGSVLRKMDADGTANEIGLVVLDNP